MTKSIYTFLSLVALIGIAWNSSSPLPPGAVGKYLDGVFPDKVPGEAGAWKLVDNHGYLTIESPVSIHEQSAFDGFLVLSKVGKIYHVDEQNSSQHELLDISERVFYKSDAGALGFALHPKFGDDAFPSKQVMFLYYKTKPMPSEWDRKGFSRLSKFTWDGERFDPDSEEILIQQYDRGPWHNGGPLFFDKDGLLFFSVGDEGNDEHQAVSTQRLDGGFFNGVFRIDIDNDPSRSHPIRRQPVALEAPPTGWGETYSQGYSIPNDNPWQNEDGSIMEEFYAVGPRSPFKMSMDDETGKIWLVDVGSNKLEEINRVEKGDNLQWPYIEGDLVSDVHEKPDPLIGVEKEPYHIITRDLGSCVVGGGLYKGEKFPSLYDRYLYADFVSNKVSSISNEVIEEPEVKIIISNPNSQQVTYPEKPGFTGVHILNDGRVFITVVGEDSEEFGSILELASSEFIPDPPEKLSDLGVFADLTSLEVRPGILPYSVNSPLWSDGAAKKRWIALPNDGAFDDPSERISFDPKDDWSFPEGTVFIKQFDLPVDLQSDNEVTRLETRFFIITKTGGYGLTYKWNEEGTDATLLKIAAKRDIDIYDDGAFAYTQTWKYPSRSQCLTCHSANANYVLGVKTHQLNKTITYDDFTGDHNQLEYFNAHGMFASSISKPNAYPKSYDIEDNNVSLETRIKSYLDANCSSCHRSEGIPTVDMDFRYGQSNLQSYYNLGVQSHASTPNAEVIVPGDHASSELWIRDASFDENRMPPLGRDFVDQMYVDSLAKWIDNISEDGGFNHKVLVYPNPTQDYIAISINKDWQPPFTMTISNLEGRMIHYEEFDQGFKNLDISDFAAGTYFVDVSTGSQRVTQKVVKL